MRIYFAGCESVTHLVPLLQSGVRHLMFSYATLRKRGQLPKLLNIINEFPDIHIFMDSGATSFNGERASTYFEAYKAFLHTYGHRFQYASEFDIDAYTSQEQLRDWRDALVDVGTVSIVPVWHEHRGTHAWDAYCDDPRFIHLAFGSESLKVKNPESRLRLIARAHQYNKTVHGYAETKVLTTLRQTPYDTVASATWKSGERYGVTYIFQGQEFKTLTKNQGGKEARKTYRKYFQSIGCDVSKILKDDPIEVRRANIIAWKKLSDRLATIHSVRKTLHGKHLISTGLSRPSRHMHGDSRHHIENTADATTATVGSGQTGTVIKSPVGTASNAATAHAHAGPHTTGSAETAGAHHARADTARDAGIERESINRNTSGSTHTDQAGIAARSATTRIRFSLIRKRGNTLSEASTNAARVSAVPHIGADSQSNSRSTTHDRRPDISQHGNGVTNDNNIVDYSRGVPRIDRSLYIGGASTNKRHFRFNSKQSDCPVRTADDRDTATVEGIESTVRIDGSISQEIHDDCRRGDDASRTGTSAHGAEADSGIREREYRRPLSEQGAQFTADRFGDSSQQNNYERQSFRTPKQRASIHRTGTGQPGDGPLRYEQAEIERDEQAHLAVDSLDMAKGEGNVVMATSDTGKSPKSRGRVKFSIQRPVPATGTGTPLLRPTEHVENVVPYAYSRDDRMAHEAAARRMQASPHVATPASPTVELTHEVTAGITPIDRVQKGIMHLPGVPQMQCSTCALQNDCPKFEEGANCAFTPLFLSVGSRRAEDVMDTMASLFEDTILRYRRRRLHEEISLGGMADKETTKLGDVAMKQAEQLMNQMKGMKRTKITGRGEGVLSKIFGSLGVTGQETTLSADYELEGSPAQESITDGEK